jgi:hypothetical protein
MYEAGEGIKKDIDEAICLYKKASERSIQIIYVTLLFFLFCKILYV